MEGSSRLTPFDAECAVLGGIINNNTLMVKVGLQAEDFSHLEGRVVWESMVTLAGEGSPIDELTLAHDLRKRSKSLDAFLAMLTLRCPITENVLAYASIVREASQLRELYKLAGNVGTRIAAGADSETVRDLLSQASERLEGSTVAATLADRQLEADSGGLESGLGIETLVPGGIPRDKITVIFGETGHFKTTVKNAILFHLAAKGIKCLDVSLEDSSALTKARFIAQRTGLPYGAIAAGTVQAPPLSESDQEILGHIVDGSNLEPTASRVISTARRLDVAAVFIDYLQLLDGHSQEHGAIAESMRMFQLSAARDGIAYVLLSQVKQDVRYRALQRDQTGKLIGDPRPCIRDCFGSASIATASKLGIGVFRPFNYRPAPTSETGPVGEYTRYINNHPGGIDHAMNEYAGILELIVSKNVLGPQGKVLVHVTPETGAIRKFNL